MSAQSEAAELAAKAVGKGALHLIKWGKKIIPATADEIAEFGPNAARVKALLGMAESMSDDAGKLASNVLVLKPEKTGMLWDRHDAMTRALDANFGSKRGTMQNNVTESIMRMGDFTAPTSKYKSTFERNRVREALNDASTAEVVSDLITPEFYSPLTNPMAVARAFELSVPRTPEGFINIARSLGERGLITAPKDIRIAQQISQLPPAMQQVYLDLVGEGTDPAQLLQALRLMGQ